MLLLSNNIHDYRIVSQGKTHIPGVDDAAEWVIIDVRLRPIQFDFDIAISIIVSMLNKLKILFIFLTKLHAASSDLSINNTFNVKNDRK